MKKLLIALVMICWAGWAQGATYYIDYNAADDSANGTAKLTPWKRAPGMPGFAGSYSHSAGDKFIFKGNVTWPYVSGGTIITIGYSGTNGNIDEYTVDETWFTGAEWGYPVFDGGNPSVDIRGVYAVNRSYIKIYKLKFINIGNIISAGGTGIRGTGGSYVYIDSNYLSPNCVDAIAWNGSGTNSYWYFTNNTIRKTGRVTIQAGREAVDHVYYSGNTHEGGWDFDAKTYHTDGLMIAGDGIDDYAMKYVYIYGNKWWGDWQKASTAQLYMSGSNGIEVEFVNGTQEPTTRLVYEDSTVGPVTNGGMVIANGGTGYTATTTGVPTTGGTGTGCTVKIVSVTDGVVTAVSVVAEGTGYTVGDTLTLVQVGGSGGTVTVGSVRAGLGYVVKKTLTSGSYAAGTAAGTFTIDRVGAWLNGKAICSYPGNGGNGVTTCGTGGAGRVHGIVSGSDTSYFGGSQIPRPFYSMQYTYVYNNIFTVSHAGGGAINNRGVRANLGHDNLFVYNNTFDYSTITLGATMCVYYYGGAGAGGVSVMSNVTVKNNICVNAVDGGVVGTTITGNHITDNNLIKTLGGGNLIWTSVARYNTCATAQVAGYQNEFCSVADPTFTTDPVFATGGTNDECTASLVPYQCCTGAGTGTCDNTSYGVNNGVFTLVEGSPAIGQGTSDLSSIFTTDYAGTTRTTWDVGAYFYDAGGGADVTAPAELVFVIPATATSLVVDISTFTATDAVGVTGYCIVETDSSAGCVWHGAAQTTYTFATEGAKTLYAFARDAAGNVSSSATDSVTITLADTTAPAEVVFTMPATSATLAIAVSSFTATDAVGVTGYKITESATPPLPSPYSVWSATAPETYTVAANGTYTLYPWAEDAAGNVSAVFGTPRDVVVTQTDVTAPEVTELTVDTAWSNAYIVPVVIAATDDTGVTGYLVNEVGTTPSVDDAGWSVTPQASYTFATKGIKTLYGWAKDAVGNISAGQTATVTVQWSTSLGSGPVGTLGSGAVANVTGAVTTACTNTTKDTQTGTANAYRYVGYSSYLTTVESFTASTSYDVRRTILSLRKYGTGGSCTVFARIYSDTAGAPGDVLATSTDSVEASALTTACANYTFNFAAGSAITAASVYWVGITTSYQCATLNNWPELCYANTGTGSTKTWNLSAWVDIDTSSTGDFDVQSCE